MFHVAAAADDYDDRVRLCLLATQYLLPTVRLNDDCDDHDMTTRIASIRRARVVDD
jgi:hypothetical protein